MNRTHLFSLLKAIISLALIILLFKMVGNADWKTILKVLNPALILGMMLVYFGGQALSTLRWRILSSDVGLKDSFKNMYRDYLAGIFYSLFLPTSVGGDLVKAWRLSTRFPKSHIKAILSTLAERLNGFAFINLITLIALPIFKVNPVMLTVFKTNFQFEWWAFWLLSFGFASVSLLICYGLPHLENAPVGRWLFHRIQNSINKATESLTRSGRKLDEPEPESDIQHPEKLWPHAAPTTKALFFSFAVHAVNIALQYTFLSLLGYPVNPLLMGAIYSLGSAASMFPLSLNGIGARESIIVVLLQAWAGVPLQIGSIFSLAWLSILLLSATPGAIITLLESFDKPSGLKESVK